MGFNVRNNRECTASASVIAARQFSTSAIDGGPGLQEWWVSHRDVGFRFVRSSIFLIYILYIYIYSYLISNLI